MTKALKVVKVAVARYANQRGWSDVHAHEIIRVVSARTIEVRRLTARLLNGANSAEADALQFSPGGFCGHTSGVQRYAFESDQSAEIVRIRFGKRGWKDAHGNFYTLSAEPHEHYDFNF